MLDAEHALTAAGHGDLADALDADRVAAGARHRVSRRCSTRRRGVSSASSRRSPTRACSRRSSPTPRELRHQLDELGAARGGFAEERAAVERAEYDLAAAQRAFAATAAPDANADDLRLAQRDLETRRDALGRIDTQLDRVAARLEGASSRVEALAAEQRRARRRARTNHLRAAGATRGHGRRPATRSPVRATRHDAAEARGARRRCRRRRVGRRAPRRWLPRSTRPAIATPRPRWATCPVSSARWSTTSRSKPAPSARSPRSLGDALERDRGRRARRGRARRSPGWPTATPERSCSWSARRPGAGAPAPGGARDPAPRRLRPQPGARARGGGGARCSTAALLVEGDWSSALELVLRDPALTVVTRAGDRFGGRGSWRLGGDTLAAHRVPRWTKRSSAPTEALDAPRRVPPPRWWPPAPRSTRPGVTRPRPREAERRAVHELDGVGARHGPGSTPNARSARSRSRRSRAEWSALHDQRAPGRRAASPTLEVRVPGARSRSRRSAVVVRVARPGAARARRTRHHGRRRNAATLDLRAAQLAERRHVLEHRLAEVDDRLAARPGAAGRGRAPPARAGTARHGLRRGRGAPRRADRPHRRAAARAGAPPAGSRPSGPRRRAGSSRRSVGRGPTPRRELLELRELLQRRDVEDAETRLRLETAVERLRTDYDVEPAVALDAPAPEVPEGTTLAGRGRDLDRELRLMGPINPLALEEHDALLERHDFLQEQLEDVKDSRRELNRVIRAVDQEIVTVFERRVRRRAARTSPTSSPRCSRVASGKLVAHRSRRPAQHRHRDGGAAVGQERAPALAALRW